MAHAGMIVSVFEGFLPPCPSSQVKEFEILAAPHSAAPHAHDEKRPGFPGLFGCGHNRLPHSDRINYLKRT